MVPGMRTESVYSLRQERLLPIPTTAARATRGCDERFKVLVRTETQQLTPAMSLKTGDLALRPAQE
jgi:hypothetical protein